MTRCRRHLGAVLLFAFACLPCFGKQMAVVVDSSNSVNSLASADLAKIFMANTKKWPDGRSVTVVFRGLASDDLVQVLQRLYKMTREETKSFLASHKNSFVTVESDEALLQLVESTPGAIGLVDVYSITSKVHILKVDGKLPLEQGYPLH